MWEERPRGILPPGLQVDLYSGARTGRKLGTAIITVVGPKMIVLRVLGGLLEVTHGTEITAVGVFEGMLMEFQTSVEWVPASADFISVSPPSSVRVRNLREHERVNLNCSCVFRPYQMDGSSRPHPEQAGTILDISKGGVSLASDRRLPSGYLALELEDGAELQLQADLAVRYSHPPTAEKPFFRSGLQILLIDPEVLSNLELFIDMELMRGSKTQRENGRE